MQAKRREGISRTVPMAAEEASGRDGGQDSTYAYIREETEVSGGGGRAAWRWGAACTLCLVAASLFLRGSPASAPVMAQLEQLASAEDEEGGLYYVGRSLADAAVAVFAPAAEEFRAAVPCSGERIAAGDLMGRESLSLYDAGEGDVCAAADGRVFYVGVSEAWGPYIRVQHDGGFASVYTGVDAWVEPGDAVGMGDIMGRAVGSTVGFALWKNGEPVDEADYVRAVP